MAEGVKEQFLSKLLDSVSVLLIILGVLLFALGLAGGITYHAWFPIPETAARIGAMVAGVVAFGFGIHKSKSSVMVPSSRTSGITINHPKEGDLVDVVDVRGNIAKALPDGYSLRVLRIYPGSDSFIPIGQARINLDEGTWEAEQCNIGGKAGDRRSIGAYLVGPAGTVLLDYYIKAARVHNAVLDQFRTATGKDGEYLPLIERRTPDMIECHRVSVRRKQA